MFPAPFSSLSPAYTLILVFPVGRGCEKYFSRLVSDYALHGFAPDGRLDDSRTISGHHPTPVQGYRQCVSHVLPGIMLAACRKYTRKSARFEDGDGSWGVPSTGQVLIDFLMVSDGADVLIVGGFRIRLKGIQFEELLFLHIYWIWLVQTSRIIILVYRSP